MPFTRNVPLRLEDALKAELREGEEIRWLGMPDPRRARRAAWPVLAFGAMFAGFAVFWMVIAGAIAWNQAPSPGSAEVQRFLPVFGLPFLLVGAGIMSVPFFAGRRARRTLCAVTDQRALRVEVRRNVRVDSWSGTDVGEVSKELFADGTGTVHFVRTPVRTRHGAIRLVNEGFVGVPDPRECETALLALKRLPGGA